MRKKLRMRRLKMSDDKCSTCRGTGYIKSYCDEPDRPCPCAQSEPSFEQLKEEAEELISMPAVDTISSNDIIEELRGRGVDVWEFPGDAIDSDTDLIEFSGKSVDMYNQPIELEGSIELFIGSVAYSVVYAVGDKETDGVIGTFPATTPVSTIVEEIVVPGFDVHYVAK
jgi:hypothetical protein